MRSVNDMNMNPIDGSTFMTILTTGLYLLAVLTLQGLAGIAAILAGLSTFAYNIYRFYNDYKKNQNKKE